MRKLAIIATLLWGAPLFAQATNYCNNQIYQTFEGGTTGSIPNATQLAASANGSNAGSWVGGFGTVTYSSVDMPALVAPGRLCGNNTTYTNSSGTHGLMLTGDGGLDFYYIEYDYPTPNTITKAVASIEYNEDFNPATDTGQIDAFTIGSNTYGIAVNAYGVVGGSRYLHLEAQGTNFPNVNWTPPTQCPCKLTLTFGTGTATTGGTVSMLVQDKNGATIAFQTGTAAAGATTIQRVRVGDQQNGSPVTSGRHVWWDNLQISLDGSTPGVFCAGASPTWTSSPDNASLQTCYNNASVGDTVNVLSGTATWNQTSTTTALLQNNNSANLAGATTCMNQGTSTASCVDSTILNMTGAGATAGFLNTILPASCPAQAATTISGITFNWQGAGGNSNQALGFYSNSRTWPPATNCFMRFTGNHIVNTNTTTAGIVFGYIRDGVVGLIDHNLYENRSGVRGEFGADGDRTNRGYLAWLTPSSLGSTQQLVMETNTFIDSSFNTEGPIDCYAGERYTFRFNYVSGSNNKGCHGTDSDSTRSMMSQESYGNTYLNNTGQSYNSDVFRGGTALVFGETYNTSGSGSVFGGFEMQCDRCSAVQCQPANGNCSGYGVANGTPWNTNTCCNYSSVGSVQNTSQGVAWVANNAYAQFAVIIPVSANNPGNNTFTNLGPACTSGGTQPTTWNQTIGGTTSEGSCTWTNSRGFPQSPPLGIFCGPTNADSLVAVGGSCPAGDTATRYFDGPTAGYPVRDQVGRIHTASAGQALAPVYTWLNTPEQLAFNFPATTYIQQNRDYYVNDGVQSSSCPAGAANNCASGVGNGTLANRPNTCTTGVAYWASDQGSWNTSGNGFGNGQLYQCVATNTWALYYTPLTYPHPLIGGGGGGGVSISPLAENFGSISIGSSSSSQTATVTNTTASAVTISSVTTTGTNAGDFPNTSNTCIGSIPPNGGSCQVATKFSPSVAGAESASLNVNLSSGTLSVALSGTGVSAGTPVIAISPSPVQFGNVVVNQSSQITVQVQNTGTANLIITSNVLAGGSGFNLGAGNCTTTLAPNGNCSQVVVFNPLSTGNQTGTLTFNSNAATSPNVVNLSGSGILVPTVGTGVILNGVVTQ